MSGARNAGDGLVRDRAGSTALIASVALPALVTALLLVMDYGGAIAARGGLQKAADTAAIAGARELMVLAAARGESAESAAAEIARQAARGVSLKSGSMLVETAFDPESGALTVDITAKAATFLAEYIVGAAPEVVARAVARPVGNTSLCVLALARTGVALQLSADSSIKALGCAIYANSSGTQSLTVQQRGKIEAQNVCTAGGYRGPTGAVAPAPTLDCPRIEDPLTARPKPPSSVCTYTNRSLNHTTAEWGPGVYCGGMYLNNGARVTLKPGVYVLKGGTLNVEGGAKLQGSGVTLHLTGGARLNVLQNSHIALSAPPRGATAGMLFFGDDDAPPASPHVLVSNNARTLLGTVYLPEATLRVGGQNPIADESPWTAVVVGQLRLEGKAGIVLNSRFDSTDVPLPEGLGVSRAVRLTQ
ncbi:MAG: pilus assembly protein TadG-related protein [Hyphomonadaceae bacterium]|nr:pilus assembly protein TadG-related protein [Hyphomonadaceae bacterium]